MKTLRVLNIIVMLILLVIYASVLFEMGFAEMKESLANGGDDGVVLGLPSLIASIIIILFLIQEYKFYRLNKDANALMSSTTFINIVALILVGLGRSAYLGEPGVGTGIGMIFTLIISAVLLLVSFILFIVAKRKINS